MPEQHVCPKCEGTQVYFAKKQIITGLGGIYGNRSKEVLRPFCKKCDIECNTAWLTKEGQLVENELLEGKHWRVRALAIIIAVLGSVGVLAFFAFYVAMNLLT
jgi:hypothetical protein